jgi:hypothetical protein
MWRCGIFDIPFRNSLYVTTGFGALVMKRKRQTQILLYTDRRARDGDAVGDDQSDMGLEWVSFFGVLVLIVTSRWSVIYDRANTAMRERKASLRPIPPTVEMMIATRDRVFGGEGGSLWTK